MNDNLSIQYMPTDGLISYARNARTHSRNQIRQVANSIKRFVYINPAVIDEKGMIMAGHARLLTAKEIGLDRIPVIRVDYLTDAWNTVTRPRDNWQVELHRLICGDSRNPDVLTRLMNRKCARMVITHPPYSITVNWRTGIPSYVSVPSDVKY